MPKSDIAKIAKLQELITPWLSRREIPPPFVEKDIHRLHTFISANCGVHSAADSPAIREALLLLHRLQNWEPYRSLRFTDRPGTVKLSPDGLPYIHHWTLEDEETAGDRPYLISGGAFEMNRRKH